MLWMMPVIVQLKSLRLATMLQSDGIGASQGNNQHTGSSSKRETTLEFNFRLGCNGACCSPSGVSA